MHELFLDIETSGTNPYKHAILSIGIVVSLNGLEDYQSFYREIKYDELIVSPEAIEINKYDFSANKNRVPLIAADEAAIIFLKKYYQEEKPVPIGLNIGSFDMQFINKQMPLLAARLSHRSVDLNSLMYLLAHKHNKNFKDFKKEISDKTHEEISKFALGVGKHNALYDAIFNLCLYLMIKKDLIH
jgi:oligoribonuclease (3'-5' exoribonuclease)